jgi:hypothetical protein
MIAAWMLRMAAASVLIGAGAWLFERVLAARGLPRRGAWVAGLLAVIGSPFIALLVPSFPDAVQAAAGLLNDGVIRTAGDTTALVVPARDPGFGRSIVAGALWLAATLAAAFVYAAGWWRLRSARRAWRQGRVAGASVLVSPGAGPAAVGVLQPAIVVPEWLLSERESVQRLVVLHEAEHLAAGDHRVLALAPLAIVLMPWNVAVWWMVRRLRLAIELDCDGRVLARGVEPSEYGSLLLDVAERRGVGALSIALASPRSGLERRIEALAGVLPDTGRGRIGLSMVAGAACVAIACTVAPTAPLERQVKELYAVVLDASATGLVDRFGGAGTRWTIDGRPATEADIRALGDGVALIRVEENWTRGIHEPGAVEARISTVHVVTPEHLAANPSLAAEMPDRAGGARLDRIRDLLKDPDLHVVIDGRKSSIREFETLDDAGIGRLEVLRTKLGDDVAAQLRVQTRPNTID